VTDIVARDPVAALVAGIAERGCAVARGALDPDEVRALCARALALDADGAFAPAGVGRGAERAHRPELRGDRIRWLDDTNPAPEEAAALALFERVRIACNRELMLGLFEFEGHFALYPAGAAYARHRDRFRDDDARVLSCVLYLNEAWQPEHGGALRVHVAASVPLDVLPEGGTLVAFLADRFDHEVLPATRARLALTGWFRRRAC
jgi:SM-20-related protein